MKPESLVLSEQLNETKKKLQNVKQGMGSVKTQMCLRKEADIFAILSEMTGEADLNPFMSLSLLHFFLHPHIMLKLGGRVPGP